MTTRRVFLGTLASGLLAAPLVEAQQTGKVYRIGMLETTSPALNAANLDAFRRGLRELGYVEGQNFTIEYRSADGRSERFPDLAAELVRLKVDVILTRGTPAVMAAKNATATIPVVMAASGDPVLSGVVSSLARPGGNVTGLSAIVVQIVGKRLELIREVVPGVSRVAALFNMSNPNDALQWKETESAGPSLRVQVQLLDVRKPGDLAGAFDAAVKQRAGALVVGLDALTWANHRPIVDLAAKHRLPAMYGGREFVDAGGLIAYGVSYPHLYHRAATYVDKILKGAKPADLPVEQPTRLELVINLKTAKALGLAIPPSLVQRADEVIQ
ncbi:MAG TPA: ABC transporter substrate-binding protein [Methylomirabilota bacterium]|nr:ABC transporter substrate-binding protein [Methylomirabilota bacterium]